MSKVLVTYVRSMTVFSTRLGMILSLAGLFSIIAILLYEAFTRFVLNAPALWSIEGAQFILGTYALLGGGYVLMREGHVRMDALYSRWSTRRKAIFDLATFFILAFYLVVFILGGINSSLYALRFGQHSASMWAPIYSPVKIIITAAAVILLLQAIALLIRDLSIVKGKPIS